MTASNYRNRSGTGPRILISNIDYAVRSGTKLRTTSGGTRMLGVIREKFVEVSP
jgi:hypothetical protein